MLGMHNDVPWGCPARVSPRETPTSFGVLQTCQPDRGKPGGWWLWGGWASLPGSGEAVSPLAGPLGPPGGQVRQEGR